MGTENIEMAQSIPLININTASNRELGKSDENWTREKNKTGQNGTEHTVPETRTKIANNVKTVKKEKLRINN